LCADPDDSVEHAAGMHGPLSLIEIKVIGGSDLRAGSCAAKMPPMSKARSDWLVAFVAVLALLLCQTAGLVHGRALDGTAGEQSGGACHSIPAEDGQPGKLVHIPCDSAQTVGETFKLPTVTPALLPFAAALIVAPAHSGSNPPVLHLAQGGAPPPLHLLHCRLRN
jgi:hypothetical protein